MNKLFLMSLLCATIATHTFTEQAQPVQMSTEAAPKARPDSCDSDHDDTVLRIKKLHARKILVKCLEACSINVTKNISTDTICTSTLRSQNICTDSLNVNNDVCFKNITTSGDLCVQGLSRLHEVCQSFRATVNYATNTPYTLGALLTYDTIVDDPNNNVTLAPMTYTVPAAGYYILNIQLDQKDIITANPILGVPTANIDVLVNGIIFRSSQFPYLTFSNVQRSTFSILIRLKKGDKVQAKYRVSAVDQTLGTIDIPGSVTTLGGPADSVFAIHYLSSDCQNVCPLSICASSCSTTCAPACGSPR